MSELKAYKMVNEMYCTDVRVIPAEVYFKSEADKVIAHNKRKRCLAMAEMCEARYDEEDAKVNGCGASWEYISQEMKYWERWRNRWLKIAEQFKEAK